MSFIGTILAALLGMALGGVANVLADDLPQRIQPRAPHCPHCQHPRPRVWWLGTLAFLTGGRRCPACGELLSWRHPILEIGLALAFAFVWNRFGLSLETAFIAAYVWVSALVTVIDVEHRLILYVVMLPAILLALVEAAVTPRLPFLSVVQGGAIGFGFVFGVFLLGEAFRRVMARIRGEAISEVAFGYGDVILATFAGLVVGVPAIWLTLIIMVFVGGAVALGYLIYHRFIRRDYSLFTALPYGPNIIVGMLVVLLWRDELRETLRRLVAGG